MMDREIKFFTAGLIVTSIAFLNAACTSSSPSPRPDGAAWGTGAFRSNGERIYFTGTNESGAAITYKSVPSSDSWMMGNGQLACASCHVPDGRGGTHKMGMMQVMTAKDIRWSVLQNEFDAEKSRLALTKGQDPDGTTNLFAYIKTLP